MHLSFPQFQTKNTVKASHLLATEPPTNLLSQSRLRGLLDAKVICSIRWARERMSLGRGDWGSKLRDLLTDRHTVCYYPAGNGTLYLSARPPSTAPNCLLTRGMTCYPSRGTLAFSARPPDAVCGNFRHRGGAAQRDFWAHRPTGALPNPCPGWFLCCVASSWKTMACFSARLDLNETSCTWASRVGGCTLSFLWLIGRKVQYCVCGLYAISRIPFHIINIYSRQWCIGVDSCLITRA